MYKYLYICMYKYILCTYVSKHEHICIYAAYLFICIYAYISTYRDIYVEYMLTITGFWFQWK